MSSIESASRDRRGIGPHLATSRNAVHMTIVAFLFSGLLFPVACGRDGGAHTATRTDDARAGIITESSESVPFDSFSDWLSYADQVSVIHVDSEREEDPAQPPGGGHFIYRYVTVSVQETLWAFRAPADTMEFLTDGWRVIGGKRLPKFPGSGPRLEVGHRYLAGLFRQRDEWGVLTQSSALPLDGDRVRVGERATPFVKTLDGLTVEQIKLRLLAAKPDPLAQKYHALPLTLRQRAMVQDQRTARRSHPSPTTSRPR